MQPQSNEYLNFQELLHFAEQLLRFCQKLLQRGNMSLV